MITDIRDITSFKWASVTGTNPLAIKLDGDSAPLALIPDSLVDPATLAAGDRVRVELSLRKVVVHGVSKGVPERGTTAQRVARYPDPTTDAQRVALANRRVQWFNTEKGWWESYFTSITTGLTVQPLRTTSGWYPMAGSGPRRRVIGAGGQARTNGQGYTNWSTTDADGVYIGKGIAANDITFDAPNGVFIAPHSGEYRFTWRMQLQAGSGTGVFGVHKLAGTWVAVEAIALMGSFGTYFMGSSVWHMLAGEARGIGVNTGTLTVGGADYDTAMMELEYISPPFLAS